MIKPAKLASVSTLAVLFLAGMAFAQTDPGVQSANRGTGATIITSDPNGFLPFFQDGQIRFQDVEQVSGGNNVGLGPRFNSNSCVSCHAQPAIGGRMGPSTHDCGCHRDPSALGAWTQLETRMDEVEASDIGQVVVAMVF